MGAQQERAGRRYARSFASRTTGGRAQADGAHGRWPGQACVHASLADKYRRSDSPSCPSWSSSHLALRRPTPEPHPSQLQGSHVRIHYFPQRPHVRPSLTLAGLKAEGFGVLSDIDLAARNEREARRRHAALSHPRRLQPPLAHQSLRAIPDIGLLLPCNVIVREESPGRAVVGFLDPQITVNLVGKSEVKAVTDAAAAAAARLREFWRQHDTGHMTSPIRRKGLQS